MKAESVAYTHNGVLAALPQGMVSQLELPLIPLVQRDVLYRRYASRLPCRTGDAAFTAVGAPAHLEASAMVAGGAGSIPRKRKPRDGGFAS